MDERKYRQRGYMDSDRPDSRGPRPDGDRPKPQGPRPPIDITGPRLPRLVQAVTAARLAEHVVIQKYDVTILEAIAHVVEHFGQHTGQIMFVTKMLTGKDLGYYRHLKTTAAHAEKTP